MSEPQPVVTPLTVAALSLVRTVRPGGVAFVPSPRGGDFELHLTFIVQAGEAGVALAAPAGLIS